MEIDSEFASAQLGDKRLDKRLIELAKLFEKRHGKSINFSCGDWKSSKAAYRFFDNERFAHQELPAVLGEKRS